MRSKTGAHDSALVATRICWSPVRQTCGLRVPCIFVSENAGTRGFKWIGLVGSLLRALARNMTVLPARLIFMRFCPLHVVCGCGVGADPCYEPCKQVQPKKGSSSSYRALSVGLSAVNK